MYLALFQGIFYFYRQTLVVRRAYLVFIVFEELFHIQFSISLSANEHERASHRPTQRSQPAVIICEAFTYAHR